MRSERIEGRSQLMDEQQQRLEHLDGVSQEEERERDWARGFEHDDEMLSDQIDALEAETELDVYDFNKTCGPDTVYRGDVYTWEDENSDLD